MCDDCVNKLPNYIKFELWRPLEDQFQIVFNDAHLYLVKQGMKLDTVDFPNDSSEPF